jgi:lipid IVA palmitoyltransferase
MLGRIFASFLLGSVLATIPAVANADGFGEALATKYERSLVALRDGRWEAYATGYTWHAPWAYDADKRGQLNDAGLGGGLGRSVVDANGDTHSLYGLAFRDSHYKTQYTAGYAWMTYWPAAKNVDIGLGYTVFLFARSDIAHYAPLPLAGLLASVRRGDVELMGTVIPGIAHDSGNIAFFFVRWSLG